MDRMKYLSTGFLVYQLSEKSNYLEHLSLGLFYVMDLGQQREKVKHRMVFYLFLEQQLGKTRGKSSHC